MIKTFPTTNRLENTKEYIDFIDENMLEINNNLTNDNCQFIVLVTTPEVYSEDHEDIIIKMDNIETIIKLDKCNEYMCIIFSYKHNEHITKYNSNKHFIISSLNKKFMHRTYVFDHFGHHGFGGHSGGDY